MSRIFLVTRKFTVQCFSVPSCTISYLKSKPIGLKWQSMTIKVNYGIYMSIYRRYMKTLKTYNEICRHILNYCTRFMSSQKNSAHLIMSAVFLQAVQHCQVQNEFVHANLYFTV